MGSPYVECNPKRVLWGIFMSVTRVIFCVCVRPGRILLGAFLVQAIVKIVSFSGIANRGGFVRHQNKLRGM